MFRASIGVIAFAGLTAFACGSSLQPGGKGGAGGDSATTGSAGTTGGGGSGPAGSTGEGGSTGAAGTPGTCAIDLPHLATPLVVASIHVTASTNSGTIDVVIYSDASAVRTTGTSAVDGSTLTPDPAVFRAGSPEVITFLCDLAAAGPVMPIPITGACFKSASFGTTMTVTTDGQTSGDLECLAPEASPAANALSHDCDVLTARRS
jgi:hypothetical protein